VGRDHGTWRRILVYVFKMKFLDKPDPHNEHEYKCDVKLVNEVPYNELYRQAYMSILVYFYEMYRDKYNYNLENIPRNTINVETQNYRDDQDSLEKYISSRVKYIGKTYADSDEKVPNISLPDLANKYLEWHRRELGDISESIKDISREFKKTRLKKYIVTQISESYLVEHRILNIGERWEENVQPKNNDDIYNDTDVPSSNDMFNENEIEEIEEMNVMEVTDEIEAEDAS
jgi:hypothetical protein